uniref:Phosphoglycerate mutase (2,3-diphosphoglycerate-dependent) n=1 Tax=Coccolithus braarudii TaxID=221442 RepID=A0A7S0KZ69_9EUKA
MGARRLILVRHGAVSRVPRAGWPDIAPVRDGAFYGGNIDVPLSQRGEAEAHAAATWIAEKHADEVACVWSSPMSRALFGARAIATAVQSSATQRCTVSSVSTHEAFREFDRGMWTNMTKEEVEADPRWGTDSFARCAREPMYGRNECKGEGMGDLKDRVLTERDELLSTLLPGSAAVLVSHLWVTRSLLGEALGEEDPLAVDVPTASVSVVDYPARFKGQAGVLGMPADCRPIVIYAAHKPELEAAVDASLDVGQAEI